MKTVKFFIATIIVATMGMNGIAQNHDHSAMVTEKTANIKVWGNCGMCKTRIEKTAKIEGVSKAEWNQETKVLTLTYDPNKVKTDDVEKKIAAVGHDTDKFTGDKKAYDKLPGCCKYDRKK